MCLKRKLTCIRVRDDLLDHRVRTFKSERKNKDRREKKREEKHASDELDEEKSNRITVIKWFVNTNASIRMMDKA